MAQAVERWSARAIWVISRADESYPRRWKERLKEDCPPILYGCGDVALLARGGLAVVGSRHADDDTLAWARHVGATAAEAGVAIVSGGARGIDDAAVRGSLEAGGRASVVLADSLEREAIHKANRQPVVDKRLVIVSPYDPAERFNVGHAMGRNKLIHCLADASLVVCCDAGSGGTWSGAVEHLGREGATALYVRNGAEAPEGNRALLAKRAVPWPEPTTVDALRQAVESAPLTKSEPIERSLFPDRPVEAAAGTDAGQTPASATDVVIEPAPLASRLIYDVARPIILELLLQPYGEKELAAALGIPAALAKQWLATLMVENGVEKAGQPARYRLPAAAAPLSIGTPDPNR
jgi:predicted Rossmann fold nucleotide-binding protein DprA/Smf involved in DNA uptake